MEKQAGRTLRPQNLRLALRASSGLVVGQIYPLSQHRNILGRSVDAVVPLDDERVSRKHATVDIQNGFHYVVDLGSVNGTYLNGKKIDKAHVLQPGDELRVGSTVFRVELLEQVRLHAGPNWRESTRVIALASDSAKAPAEPLNATGARWVALIDLAPREALFTPRSRRWMAGLVGAALVGAALYLSY